MTALDTFAVGARAEVAAEVTEAMVDAFAALSGDVNAVHMDAAAARAMGFPQRVAHGCLTLSLLSTLIGTRLPGAGALWRTVDVEWVRPVFPGDRVVVAGEVVQKSAAAESMVIKAEARNQSGTVVMRATATVGLLAPSASASASASPSASPSPSASASPSPSALPSRRVVLVTGGSRGIGRAIATALGHAGYAVGVGYHRAEAEAAAVAAELPSAQPVRLDVTAAIDLGELERTLGAPTALVHCATPPLALKKLGDAGLDDDLDGYFAAYVRAPLALVRRMEPAMAAARWGRVILLGTSAAIGPPPARMTAYVTAKSALLGLARSLAVELGPSGVTVNVVSPGLTATDLTRDVSPRAQLSEAQRTPLRRLATPDDAASLCRFLMSDGAAFISGAHLPITGGLTMI